jgi:hypothetical protein
MVTLHILQLLENEGFGSMNSKADGLFYEYLPLDGIGVAIMSRGTTLQRGLRDAQDFDLYSRGASNLLGAHKLEKIKDYFDNTYQVCELPTTPKSNKVYKNAAIIMTSNIENIGLDEMDRVIFRVAAQIIYNKETNL